MSLIKGYIKKNQKPDSYVKKFGLAIQVMKIAYVKGDLLPLAETGPGFLGRRGVLVSMVGQNFWTHSWSEGNIFSLSGRLSELTYHIHFGTLKAKGMLPAETQFLQIFSFLAKYIQGNRACLSSLTNALNRVNCTFFVLVLFCFQMGLDSMYNCGYLWSHGFTFLSLVDAF